MTKEKTTIIKRRYDRIAKVYDILDSPMEMLAFRRYRQKVLAQVRGRVLEVGVGTGRNIEFYPDKYDNNSRIKEITAIDFSKNMLAKARERAEKLNKTVKLQEMDVQELEFPDNYFDSVFSTCAFCSVPDPIKGLLEIKRVLKPEGELVLLEHVRSSSPIIGTFMDLMNPIPVTLWGANINRKTLRNLKKAGYEIISVDNLSLDILKFIVAKK